MIIALDGPSGSGKSTIAKRLAKELNIDYLDTGAMYRAVCYYVLENDIDIEKDKGYLKDINILVQNNKVILNGIDITNLIRVERINSIISQVSQRPEVREKLIAEQRKISEGKDIVLDGRDIASVVFPNADFKFYIDASSDVRAKRRVTQNNEMGIEEDYQTVKKSIERRDFLDKQGPLKRVEEATYIDTSDITLDEVIDIIRKEINDK